MARVALVTGGQRGIGAAISEGLKAAGRTVVASYAGNDAAAKAFTERTGIEAHVCVLQTGLDLLDAGSQVHVLSDGVFSRMPENQQLALMRLHDAGATVTSVEIVLFEMVRTSTHPQFRTISKLIK